MDQFPTHSVRPNARLAEGPACVATNDLRTHPFFAPHAAARKARPGLFWACVFSAHLVGCLGPVAQAPFSQRTGLGKPGSLLGPFSGQVLDGSTKNPLASALVIGTWTFEEENALSIPKSSHTVSLITGSDGLYQLPAVPPGRQFAGLLRRFTLVVYKAGFVGYRSDQRFEDGVPRRDFVQHGNVVQLDRFPQNESHVRHLVFLGTSQALQSATQAENIAAALELDQTAPQLAAEPAAGPAAEPGNKAQPSAVPTDVETEAR